MVKCPNCGHINDADAKFCENCGESLEEIQADEKNVDEPSTLVIVLGYVLGILGIFTIGILSIIGLIIGIMLYRKGHPKGKTHGLIIMIISVAILLLVGLALGSLIMYRAYFYTG